MMDKEPGETVIIVSGIPIDPRLPLAPQVAVQLPNLRTSVQLFSKARRLISAEYISLSVLILVNLEVALQRQRDFIDTSKYVTSADSQAPTKPITG